MRFYSDKTNKVYDTVEELKNAENVIFEEEVKRKMANEEKRKAEEKKKAEQANRKQEVLDAFKAMTDAKHKYNELLSAYVNDYKTFDVDTDVSNVLPHLFERIFNL